MKNEGMNIPYHMLKGTEHRRGRHESQILVLVDCKMRSHSTVHPACSAQASRCQCQGEAPQLELGQGGLGGAHVWVFTMDFVFVFWLTSPIAWRTLMGTPLSSQHWVSQRCTRGSQNYSATGLDGPKCCLLSRGSGVLTHHLSY